MKEKQKRKHGNTNYIIKLAIEPKLWFVVIIPILAIVLGQKQRVALARAYYKDASIVIFDEPSASIDPESEAEIFAAISEMRRTKNIWLISHRLSTCILSDRILLFKDGTLIGNGNHNDLIKTNDEYKRMFQFQADRYEVNL